MQYSSSIGLPTFPSTAQNAYGIAKARFDAGGIDYLTLLETHPSLSQAEDDEVVATVTQVEAFVQLHKALGA